MPLDDAGTLRLWRGRARACALGLAGAWVLAVSARVWGAEPSLVPILVCEARGPQEVRLEVVLLNTGPARAGGVSLRVEFADPTVAGAPFEGAAPRPRALVLPVAVSDWQKGQLAVLSLGCFALDRATPHTLQVRGGLDGDTARVLGVLEQAAEGGIGQGPRFVRAWPGPAFPAGRSRLWVSAAVIPADDAGALTFRLIYSNCGESLGLDYDAFLHFETEATGEHLERTMALGLYPLAVATDSAAWSASEFTVVDVGPFRLPADTPEFLYLRAGLYDRRGGAGTGKRLPLAGPDGSDRALVGRLVTRAGSTRFERIVTVGEATP